jgi:hypothetical protein
MIVYISIGNSDDKLSQADWVQFIEDVDGHIDESIEGGRGHLHGRWFAAPNVPWRSACWCVGIIADPHLGSRADWLRDRLSTLAATYNQDSIAFAVADTEFIKPS